MNDTTKITTPPEVGDGEPRQPQTVAETAMAKFLAGNQESLIRDSESADNEDQVLVGLEETLVGIQKEVSDLRTDSSASLDEFNENFPAILSKLEAAMDNNLFPEEVKPIASEALISVKDVWARFSAEYSSLDEQFENMKRLKDEKAAEEFRASILSDEQFNATVSSYAELSLRRVSGIFDPCIEAIREKRAAVQKNISAIRTLLGMTDDFDANADVSIGPDDLEARKERFSRFLHNDKYHLRFAGKDLDSEIHSVTFKCNRQPPAEFRAECVANGLELPEGIDAREQEYASLLNLIAFRKGTGVSIMDSCVDRIQGEMEEKDFHSLVSSKTLPDFRKGSYDKTPLDLTCNAEGLFQWRVATHRRSEYGSPAKETSLFSLNDTASFEIDKGDLLNEIRIAMMNERIEMMKAVFTHCLSRGYNNSKSPRDSFAAVVSEPLKASIPVYLLLMKAFDAVNTSGPEELTAGYKAELTSDLSTREDLNTQLQALAKADPTLFAEMQAVVYVGNAQNTDMDIARDFTGHLNKTNVSAHGIYFDLESEELTIKRYHEYVELLRKAVEAQKPVSTRNLNEVSFYTNDPERAEHALRELRSRALLSISDLHGKASGLQKERDTLDGDLEDEKTITAELRRRLAQVSGDLAFLIDVLNEPRGFSGKRKESGRPTDDYVTIARILGKVKNGEAVPREAIDAGTKWPK